MKLLLVALNAKYIHSNPAVYSLITYAKEYSGHISLIELTINHSEDEVLQEIYKQGAEVVAFSCYIWNIDMVTRVAVELKKVCPDIKLWAGGPEVSYDTEDFLKGNAALDGVVIGEGEQTFLELAKYYIEGSTRLEDIAGIAFKKTAKPIQSDLDDMNSKQEDVEDPNIEREESFGDNKDTDYISGSADRITVTGERPLLSLDSIPFPYENTEAFLNRIIYYESSRGCPFSCSYCLSSIDKRVRFRNTELVKKELKLFLEQKVPQVKFIDRTFNCSRKHAMQIWEFIKDNDNGVTNFHFEISADLLEEDELSLLAELRPGQVQFEIGVQTTNPDTVEAVHRRMDLDKLCRNVSRLRQNGNIHLHLDLIAGLPLEDYDSFENSFAQVYRLRPDQLQLGFLKVLKGSRMEKEAGEYGIICRSTPPYEVLSTSRLPYAGLLRLKGISEMVEVYYNSGQFMYSVGYLEHFFTSPMRLYEAISEYYEGRQLAMMSHSRIKRYEILLDFFKEKVLESNCSDGFNEQRNNSSLRKDCNTGEGVFVACSGGLFEELLVFDLYLREDLKSRPAFSPEKPKKEIIRALYDKHPADREATHIELFRFDVQESSREGRAILKDTVVLFDYGSRNPLNNAAKVRIL